MKQHLALVGGEVVFDAHDYDIGRDSRMTASPATRLRSYLLPGLLVAVLLAACTPLRTGDAPSPSATDWPQPSATRPVMNLEFRVGEDLASVAGTERVVFTPDLEVCELVFRAWPNKPATAAQGNSLAVLSAVVDGAPAQFKVVSAGARGAALGTLVEVDLPACVPAGTRVTTELAFQVKLGRGTDERVGVARRGNLAWLGTAYPLLAWQNGVGWARDDAVLVAGEMATSETFDLASLRVVAPSRYSVMGAGERVEQAVDKASGTTTHTFKASALRDLTVTIGEFDVVERRVGETTIVVGGPTAGIDGSLDEWADVVAEEVKDVGDYLGPVPYGNIWVSLIPDQSDGIEYPGAMQLGRLDLRRGRWLVTHEVAHLWFYGLVGNNQAQHPWLDESFASFVQRLVDDPDHDPELNGDYPDWVATQVGLPMAEWEPRRRANESYVSAVYEAGSDMLIEARRDAGAEAFDGALRDYLRSNAHQIATPEDVEKAFGGLPGVMDRLEAANVSGRSG